MVAVYRTRSFRQDLVIKTPRDCLNKSSGRTNQSRRRILAGVSCSEQFQAGVESDNTREDLTIQVQTDGM